MILVTNFFFEKSEGNKGYKRGTKISHFTKERETYLIKKGYALKVVEKKEKKEGNPTTSKKEKT